MLLATLLCPFPLFSFLPYFCCYSFCPFWLSKSTSACKTFAILILFWVRFQFASATNFRFIATFRGFHKFSSQRFALESFRHHTQTHLSCGLRVLYRVFFPSFCSLTPLILQNPKKVRNANVARLAYTLRSKRFDVGNNISKKCVERGISYCSRG